MKVKPDDLGISPSISLEKLIYFIDLFCKSKYKHKPYILQDTFENRGVRFNTQEPVRIEERRVVQVREEAETIPLTAEEEELEMGELEMNQISHFLIIGTDFY